MSSPEPTHYITENTVLPRSDVKSDRFWKIAQSTGFDCPEAFLLVWRVFGPLTDISVLNSTVPASEAFKKRVPFVTANPDGSQTFHPIASLPATYPLVSHITASVGIFDDFLPVSERITELYDFDWDKIHDGTNIRPSKCYCLDEECKDQPYLFMLKEPTLSIEAREKPYVTLGEAVCAIHHWLHTLQEEILIAETALWEDPWGFQTPLLPRDTKFWVEGLSGTGVYRQGGVGSGEQWNPETEGEWEERLTKAREMREFLRSIGHDGVEK